MAKKYNNDKDFLVIEMSYEEARDICGFGIDFVDKETGLVYDHKIVCDTCNNSVTDNVYYVAVLNRALCKECCDDFIKNIDRSPEDIPYEVRHYNFYAEKLNLEKSMTQEDKELLLKDICARLPYDVRLKTKQPDGGILSKIEITGDYNARITITCHGALSAKEITFPLHSINDHPLYLRSKSSMTEEEIKEYYQHIVLINDVEKYDWLNAHYFDYRGLIERGLAIEVDKDFYK